MISALDEGIGNVTKALKRNKMYEDTAIIFLSDNGGYSRASNWPLRGKKNSVHEGGTRTVSLFHYPRVKPQLQGDRYIRHIIYIRYIIYIIYIRYIRYIRYIQ